MTAYADAEKYSGTLIHSLRTRSGAAGNDPNDRRHTGPRSYAELKTPPVATAQLAQPLRGSQLLSNETGHRTRMERLLRIAEQVDERTPRQSEALQREHKGERQQIMREELETGRGPFPEQLRIILNQCEAFGRQLQIVELGLKEIKQELRSAEKRIQKTATEQHNALEQSLRATEPKIEAGEQNWRRIDEWRQNAEQRFNDTDEQLQATVQRLQDFQQQLTDAVSQIKTFEPQIKSCEDRLERNTVLPTKRLENVEVSIGALVRHIEQLKADRSEVSDARLKKLQAMFNSNRRMQGLAFVAWMMSLLLVGYIGFGNRAWSIFAEYLSQ
jgi:chromosome segregation ATPase